MKKPIFLEHAASCKELDKTSAIMQNARLCSKIGLK